MAAYLENIGVRGTVFVVLCLPCSRAPWHVAPARDCRLTPCRAVRHALLGAGCAASGLWQHARRAFAHVAPDGRPPSADREISLCSRTTGRGGEVLCKENQAPNVSYATG